ncbi:chemotaxis protein CheW [Candidatus Riflebacteria bacterium]
MLTLLFYLGKDRFAVDSSKVVEVIPSINLKKLTHAPPHVAGIFDYRGLIVPVIDLSILLNKRTSQERLSTRIILFRYAKSTNKEGEREVIGLMAERVTETRKMSLTDFQTTGVSVEGTPYLAEIATTENEMIQFIRVENLLKMSLHRGLLLPEKGQFSL